MIKQFSLTLILTFAYLHSQAQCVRANTLDESLLFTADAIELPKPGGAYVVGTVIYNWIDASRADIVSAAPDDKRQLVVQIWYPAEVKPDLQTAPYMPEMTVLRPAFKQGADQLERIGGSRAQLDLVEFTRLKAYAGAGRADDALRVLSMRGRGSSRIPVAGFAAAL